MGDLDFGLIKKPVIFANLSSAQQRLSSLVSEIKSLPKTEESLKQVNQVRSSITKEFEALEEQRKAVKREILRPYEEVEATYKDLVSGPYRLADKELKQWVDDYMSNIKSDCEKILRDYFCEVCESLNIGFLKFEDCGVTVDAKIARQKYPQKAIDKIYSFVNSVRTDIDVISGMEYSADIFAAYKDCLSLSSAVAKVQNGRNDTVAAHLEIEKFRLLNESENAEYKRVYDDIEERPEEVTVSFAATGTLDQLKKLKAYGLSIGIKFEKEKNE